MKFGFITSFGSAHEYILMAREAERHGWDGVFVWDDISVEPRDVFDPWVMLGAMSAVTERITLGAMVFSLARRRPWKVARETLTIDHLSNGRFVLPVGLGGTWDGGYSRVNTDDPDRKIRAAKLDECLEILKLAWTGDEVGYDGTHYRMRQMLFQPKPVQQPRIPVWPVGAWPHARSLRRAARWDGIIATDASPGRQDDAVAPGVVAQISSWMNRHRTSSGPFDIVVEGTTSGTDRSADRAMLEPLEAAGATWWIESRWDRGETPATLLARIRQGPPSANAAAATNR